MPRSHPLRPALRTRALLAFALLAAGRPALAQDSLLNVSFDPTRELYHDFDQVFAAQWQARTGQALAVHTTNGGSASQARAVLAGEPADVVTLALAADIDVLAQAHLLAPDWATRLPNRSVPFTSVAVLLVRKGNPLRIHGWADLARPGISVITPDPASSGGGRWNYLAALGWARHQPGATQGTAEAYLQQLYANVAVLDTGARGATNTFVQRGIGDVLITAECEAQLALRAFGGGGFQVVYPDLTIREDSPVAVVDSVVDHDHSRAAAEAYLAMLWTPAGQQIIAAHHFRPTDPAVARAHAADFPPVATFDIDSLGGWARVQPEQFGPDGAYARIAAELPPRP